MSCYPILIGSYGLKEYGYTDKWEDIDLIVDVERAKDIYFACDKKEDKICWFNTGNGSVKVDLIFTEATSSNEFIFSNLNLNKSYCKIVFLFNGLEVLLPPLKVLYAIKKSHIHRILPVTQFQNQNIEIWKKHNKAYEWMRHKLDYKELDNIIYGEEKYGEPIKLEECISTLLRNDDEKEKYINYLTNRIFIMRFDETNKRVGDTNVSLEVSEEEFFKDNVERFINHDLLHEKVSESFSESKEVLFKKLQKDYNKIQMDKNMFFTLMTDKERIQLLMEEIIVLFMERKWIPELVKCYKIPNFPPKYILEEKENQLVEIIIHFITNLCGSNHAWLRQYALDHYSILNNLDLYNIEKCFQLGCSISGTKSEQEIKRITEEDFYNQVKNNKEYKYNDNHCLPKQLYNSDESNSDGGKSSSSDDSLSGSDEDRPSKYCFKVFDLNLHRKKNFRIKDYFINDTIDKYLDIIEKSKNLLYFRTNKDKFILYSWDKKFGLYFINEYSDNGSVFTCEISEGEHTVSYDGLFLSLGHYQTENISLTYQGNYKQHYYYSQDDSCGWRNKNEGHVSKYISSYGNGPKDLTNMFEKVARLLLKIKKDSK